MTALHHSYLSDSMTVLMVVGFVHETIFMLQA